MRLNWALRLLITRSRSSAEQLVANIPGNLQPLEKMIPLFRREAGEALNQTTHLEFVVNQINHIGLITLTKAVKPLQKEIGFFVHWTSRGVYEPNDEL